MWPARIGLGGLFSSSPLPLSSCQSPYWIPKNYRSKIFRSQLCSWSILFHPSQGNEQEIVDIRKSWQIYLPIRSLIRFSKVSSASMRCCVSFSTVGAIALIPSRYVCVRLNILMIFGSTCFTSSPVK